MASEFNLRDAPDREETTLAEVIRRIREGAFYEDYDWASGPALRALDRAVLSGVVMEIAAERHRQITDENWSPEHDDEHDKGEMAQAASAYALAGSFSDWARQDGFLEEYKDGRFTQVREIWPADWDWRGWWKPYDRRRDLVRAGALIAAEIERLDRTAKATSPTAMER